MNNWISTRCKLGTHAVCPGYIGQIVCFCECHERKDTDKPAPALADLLPETSKLLADMRTVLSFSSSSRFKLAEKWLKPMRDVGVTRWNVLVVLLVSLLTACQKPIEYCAERCSGIENVHSMNVTESSSSRSAGERITCHCKPGK